MTDAVAAPLWVLAGIMAVDVGIRVADRISYAIVVRALRRRVPPAPSGPVSWTPDPVAAMMAARDRARYYGPG